MGARNCDESIAKIGGEKEINGNRKESCFKNLVAVVHCVYVCTIGYYVSYFGSSDFIE